MHHKYYFLIYIWSKLKVFDFSRSENDIYFETEGVSNMKKKTCNMHHVLSNTCFRRVLDSG